LVMRACEAASTSGCVACMNHEKDCLWCKADRKCIPADNERAKCSDMSTLVHHSEECIMITKAARMIWLLFICLLILTMVLGVGGKFLTYYLKAHPRYARGDVCKRAEVVTSLLITSTVGSTISIMIYYIVNLGLVEISLSPFYAFLVGMMLIFVGLILVWQSLVNYSESSGVSLCHMVTLCLFALIIVSSGVVCFLLEKDWTNTISVKSKIPLYALMGVSISFSVVYSAADMLHHICSRFCQGEKATFARPFVQSVTRVRLLAVTAVICGLYYGWIFGMLDSEDVNRESLELFIQKESFYCYPLAAVLGGLSAFFVHYSSVQSKPTQMEMSYIDNQGDDL